MSRRDLFFSIIGHVLLVFIIVFVAPSSNGLWGEDKPLPMFMNATIVEHAPGDRPGVSTAPPPKPATPEPAPDEVPELKDIEDITKTEKEELAQDVAPDTSEAELGTAEEEDTTETLAAVEETPEEKTRELEHTIFEGAGGEAVDPIFGEQIPASGYGGTDPYFQSLFLAIQRAFRNPVPGYKPIRCVVTFTIMNNGTIKDIELETSSGIPRFDRAAIRAIERIEWGRSFPDKFEDYDGYHIRMPFEYIPQ